MPVYLAQALCPQHHCILAAAADDRAPEALRQRLLDGVQGLLGCHAINPWCGLCGAGAASWTFEVGRTRFATLEEAKPALDVARASMGYDGTEGPWQAQGCILGYCGSPP
jgi:hypothetical protein